MNTRRSYLVIINGAGETRDDFTVLRLHDTSPEGAVEQAIAPSAGYGKQEDGTAYVVAESHVTRFIINDSRRRIAERVPKATDGSGA